MSKVNGSRRDFIRTTAYVAPAILTLTATPAFAGTGSALPSQKPTKPAKGNDDFGNGVDQPRGNPPVDAGPGTTPGNSGGRGGAGNGGVEPQPGGNPPINSGPGTSPGNSGGRGRGPSVDDGPRTSRGNGGGVGRSGGR